MPENSTVSTTVAGLKPTDVAVSPDGKVTISSDALAEAVKNKLQDPANAGRVFPDAGKQDFIRVSVDVG